jgi:lipopolysaccharide heptosyltransferase II
MKRIDLNKINKILVIKSSAIGDVLLATPVVENLRRNFPDAEIIFLTQKYCKEALSGNPFITRVLTYDLSLDGGWFIIKNIRKQRYDMVIDLFCNPRTALITFLSSAKYKVGFRFKGRSYAYNIKVKPRSSEVHNVEFNLDALRALDIKIESAQPKFYINDIHREFADNFFNEKKLIHRIVIGINPAGTWNTKVWYTEKFEELIKRFDKSCRFLIFWGNDSEKNIALRIKAAANGNVEIIPETNLKYMGALIEKCDLFLTNDTGPMHIASALGVNVAAIFGPTNSLLHGPLNKNSTVIKNTALTCLGCNLTRIKDCPNEHKCMKDLSVNTVFNEIIKFLPVTKS